MQHTHRDDDDHRHLQAQRPLRRRGPEEAQLLPARLAQQRRTRGWTRSCSISSGKSTRELGTDKPIRIVSAYRSPATNSMLRRRSRGGAPSSASTCSARRSISTSTASDVEQLRATGHAAAARRRRLLSAAPLRPCGRRLGAPLAAHDPRPARARVPERPHRARAVRRPAAARLCAGAGRYREPRHQQPLAGPWPRREHRSAATLGLAPDRRRASCPSCSASRPRSHDDEEAAASRQAKTTLASRQAVDEEPQPAVARVPLPQARPAGIDARAKAVASTGGGFGLASASSTPVTLPPARGVPRPPGRAQRHRHRARRDDRQHHRLAQRRRVRQAERPRLARSGARLCGERDAGRHPRRSR